MYILGKLETQILELLEAAETTITVKYLSESIDRSYDVTHRVVKQLVEKRLVVKRLIDGYHVDLKKASYLVL